MELVEIHLPDEGVALKIIASIVISVLFGAKTKESAKPNDRTDRWELKLRC